MADENTPKDESAASAGGGPAIKAKPQPKPKPPKQLPPYNVVLLDDDDHSYEYVIEMLQSIFNYTVEKSLKLAEEVDGSGRVIVFTTHKELAELKRDQILGYGIDIRIDSCKGSMTAVIEPAEG